MTDADRGGLEAGAELDARVAVEVLGMPVFEWGEGVRCAECGGEVRYCGARSWCSDCREWRYGPYREYSTDIAADYSVLERVRSTWTASAMERFEGALADLWRPRAIASNRATFDGGKYTPSRAEFVPTSTRYRPGDYSRAALAAADAPSPKCAVSSVESQGGTT